MMEGWGLPGEACRGDRSRGAPTILSVSVLLVSMLTLLAAGCRKPLDKYFTSDGNVVAGKVLELSGGRLLLADSTSVMVPQGPARLMLRSGASYYGQVRIEDDRVFVDCPAGDRSFPLELASVVSWADESVDHVVVDIPACAGWLNSHVAVEEGDLISLAAGGSTSALGEMYGPEGSEAMSGTASLVPEAMIGRLVLRIGQDGPVLSVGRDWSRESPADGELFLAVNSPVSGSDGVYTVSIMISRQRQDGSGPVALYIAKR
ncbi:hypothetical protein JW921_00075 [Candidatus Fermentibacterales bacterium]|nr:hypothetical protein [Candidatus Fermentibacterales bacterium]